MVRNVLVAGGAGYIGSVLVRTLIQNGYAVRVLDNLYFGDQGLPEDVELCRADIRSVGSEVLDNIESVINVAGFSNDPMANYDPQKNYEMNVLATLHLAEMCKRHNIQRYIFASSCSIYDTQAERIDTFSTAEETSQVSPSSFYARSKYEAEHRLISMIDQRFCPVILRQGTVFGYSPRMRYDLVVNAFVKDALCTGTLHVHNQGKMWRPLVDIRDVAYAYIRCLEAPLANIRGEIFNIVHDNYQVIQIAEIVQNMLQKAGIQASIKEIEIDGKERSYRASAQKAYHELNWKTEYSLESSIHDMLNRIQKVNKDELDNPIHYNIRWMSVIKNAGLY